MISSDNNSARAENNTKERIATEGQRVNLSAVREALKQKMMSQAEFAILARGEAKRLGLWRATKVSKPQVSRFLSDTLPKSQVYKAILSAVEKYLEVDELFFSDVDQHA